MLQGYKLLRGFLKELKEYKEMTNEEHKAHIKQEHCNTRFAIIMDMIDKLFNTPTTLITYESNGITLDAGSIHLSSKFNQISLEPFETKIRTTNKEMQLKPDEIEYIKFSLKLYLNHKLK